MEMFIRRFRVKFLFFLVIITLTTFTLINRNYEVINLDSTINIRSQVLQNSSSRFNLSALRRRAFDLNFQQKLHNVHKFGPPLQNDIVVAIQVHSRVHFLRQLLLSLKQAKDVDQTTLILSLDRFDPQLDELIKTIDFCRYIVIFFPFSMQLHPDSFPGQHPNDCPRDLSRHEAMTRGCNNAEHPDKYGHYREVKFVQIKHHWFWKLHTIFNSLTSITSTQFSLLLLEEDYLVLPDVFEVMKKSLEVMKESCPECKTISLGNYEQGLISDGNSLEARVWVSSKNNIGMVITKNFYEDIVDCINNFCVYDDYNWDWTLQGIASDCMGDLVTLKLNRARVIHLGGCNGIHSRQADIDCIPEELAKKVFQRLDKSWWFPDHITISAKSVTSVSKPYLNGGWGDIRDHELCKSYYKISKQVINL